MGFYLSQSFEELFGNSPVNEVTPETETTIHMTRAAPLPRSSVAVSRCGGSGGASPSCLRLLLLLVCLATAPTVVAGDAGSIGGAVPNAADRRARPPHLRTAATSTSSSSAAFAASRRLEGPTSHPRDPQKLGGAGAGGANRNGDPPPASPSDGTTRTSPPTHEAEGKGQQQRQPDDGDDAAAAKGETATPADAAKGEKAVKATESPDKEVEENEGAETAHKTNEKAQEKGEAEVEVVAEEAEEGGGGGGGKEDSEKDKTNTTTKDQGDSESAKEKQLDSEPATKGAQDGESGLTGEVWQDEEEGEWNDDVNEGSEGEEEIEPERPGGGSSSSTTTTPASMKTTQDEDPEEDQVVWDQEEEQGAAANEEEKEGTTGDNPASVPTGDLPAYVPVDDDPIKDEDMEQEEKKLEHELQQEEKVARRAGGLGIFLGVVAMIFTAHQMSENPDGIYASVCRLAITISSVVVKIVCMPCRKLLGAGNPHYNNGHMPISTSGDYGYRGDPYRSSAKSVFELSSAQ